MLRVLSFLTGLCVAPLAWAHPHVFIDATLRLEADSAGRVEAIEVTWAYDTLFSLLVLSDRAMDMDGDLVLTDAEKDALLGFDLQNWPDGFEGALFVFDGKRALQLGRAEPVSVTLVDGALVTRHRRALEPVDVKAVEALRLQPYDPYYYAAISLAGVNGLPEGCALEVIAPDTDAADALVAEMGATQNEAFFEEVKVGIHYAFTAEVTCAGS